MHSEGGRDQLVLCWTVQMGAMTDGSMEMGSMTEARWAQEAKAELSILNRNAGWVMKGDQWARGTTQRNILI